MKNYVVEPEVAGGLGTNTAMDRTVHPPVVSRLHYHFEGWLGDAILESFPCFIVTEELKQKLLMAGMTGCEFDDVEITASEQFGDKMAGRLLPRFVWLKIHGEIGSRDFGSLPDGRLVVSERALEILKEFGASHALVTEREEH